MSQSQNENRWKCPDNIKLRKGQRAILQKIDKYGEEQKEFLVTLPTGYGKSFVALIAYKTLKDMGIVDRLLLVVPTTVQQNQYVKNLKSDARLLNIDLVDVVMIEKDPYEISLSRANESDVFVTTVQKLADMEYYYQLTKTHKWFVVADEMHHYAESSSWANGFENLRYERILGMTATPLRKDKKKLLVNKDPDVFVTVNEAIEEGALRPFRLETGDYEVQITCGYGDNEEILKMSLSDIEEEIKLKGYKDISDWELKRQVRYSSKYIGSLFRKTLEIYYQLEALYPYQNQILIFAWTCEHAKQIVQIINEVIDRSDFAKAIGTGINSEEENEQIVQDYIDNKFPCLVQVNKAGEGFNNPRCVLGIMLNHIGVDTPTAQQHLGRFMRVQKNGSPNAVILCGKDHPFASADLSQLGEYSGLEDDPFVSEPPEGEGKGTCGGGGIVLPPLNEFFVEVLKLKKWECIYPFKTNGEPNPAFIQALLDSSDNSDIQDVIDKASSTKDPTILQNYVLTMLNLATKNVLEIESQGHGISRQDRIKGLRERLNAVCRVFVSSCIRLHYNGDIIPTKVQNQWFTNLHGHLASKTGKKMKERNYEELKECYEYLQELTQHINETGGIPRWMYSGII